MLIQKEVSASHRVRLILEAQYMIVSGKTAGL